jgi:hypothetical protein
MLLSDCQGEVLSNVCRCFTTPLIAADSQGMKLASLALSHRMYVQRISSGYHFSAWRTVFEHEQIVPLTSTGAEVWVDIRTEDVNQALILWSSYCLERLEERRARTLQGGAEQPITLHNTPTPSAQQKQAYNKWSLFANVDYIASSFRKQSRGQSRNGSGRLTVSW